jgi:hypothetical protein
MSTKFTVFDKATGRVLFGGSASVVSSYETETQGVLVDSEYTNGYLVDGVHHTLPSQPSPHHTFNWHTKQWEDPRTLDDLKAAQWTAIKQARSAAEYSGFTWDGSTFDSDAISQQRITGAVTLAQMDPAFSIGWTLADNTVRTLSQADMLQVGAALGAHVAAQFAKGVLLRAALEAVTTKEAVESVAW